MGAFVRWLRRHNAPIILTLSLLILLAMVYGSVRRHLVSLKGLKDTKDAFAALNSIVNVAGVVVAFLFAYFRFFAGRTFARRAEVTLSVETAAPDTGPALHAVTLKVENIGTLTIHNPELSIQVTDFSGENTETPGEIERWLSNETFASPTLEMVIDPGETAQFHAVRRVASSSWASSYAAVVRDRHGNVWQCFALTTNANSGKEPEASSNPESKTPDGNRWVKLARFLIPQLNKP